ncbi:hypothetical protein VTN77DRAFT_4605 [Rasamsonia byssochlamydoides]|uniref:uncharacterized protein n=1 Tax=Rasamsonia byssochlamydoides TaxID=89139 RepID=UPI0037423100
MGTFFLQNVEEEAKIETDGSSSLEDSPYESVRAAVRPTDGGEVANTVRAWVLGMFFVTIASGVNMFLSMRSPAISISSVAIQLLVFPIGCFWAKVVPKKVFNTFGIEWTFNTGPFNIKEHTLMANTDALIALKAKHMGWGFQLLFTLSSQLIGIALTGLFRRFLIWPSAMIWPSQFSNTSLLYALHDRSASDSSQTNGWRISRFRFFLYVALGSFAYYWIPGVLWQGLSVFSFITWIKPNDVVINQLFGGFTGLSLLPITFDWTYLNDPLLAPVHALVNTLIGLIIFIIIPTIGIAYSGALWSEYLPINTSTTYDNTQNTYNVSRILGPNFTFDLNKYKKYSPMFLAPTFALNYGLGFAALTASIVHIALYHGKEVWNRWKNGNDEAPDIHFKFMSKYRDCPQWWYGALFVVSMALGLATVLGIHHSFPIPTCMILAITNISLALDVLSPFLGGYMIPGRPIAIMVFKVYSTIFFGQAQTYAGDMKLAHYIKVPPRTVFSCQVAATIWAAFVQIAVMNWTLDNIDQVCTPEQPAHFTCPNGKTFSNSITWGVIGPKRMLGSDSIYAKFEWFWLIGALLPVLFYTLARMFPKSPVRLLNAPVMLGAMSWLPRATPLSFAVWVIVGLIFNYWIRRRWPGWWHEYNYLTAAALDSGLILSTIVIFLAITLPNVNVPQWWGNTAPFEATLDPMVGAIRWNVQPEPKTCRMTTRESMFSGRDAAVILDGSPANMSAVGGGTYPRANYLSDGSIIGAYTAFEDGYSIITLVRSTDGGGTWSPLGTAARALTKENDMDNPYPLQLPNGRVLVAFRNHSKNPSTGSYTFYRITICYSDDNGKSWRYLSTPASDPGGPNGIWEPFLRNAADGTLQLFYSRENSATDQDSLMRTSTDGGTTWSSASVISRAELKDARDGMIGVAETNDGDLLAVFETGHNGRFTINSVRSSDGGKTWGHRARVYTPTGIHNNAGAPQIANVGGKLYVSFMTDEDSKLNRWPHGAAAKLIVSKDNGKTWGGKTTIRDVHSYWPGLVGLDSHSLLYMYDHNGVVAQRVLCRD